PLPIFQPSRNTFSFLRVFEFVKLQNQKQREEMVPDSQYPLPSACPPCRHKKRAGGNYSKLSFMPFCKVWGKIGRYKKSPIPITGTRRNSLYTILCRYLPA